LDDAVQLPQQEQRVHAHNELADHDPFAKRLADGEAVLGSY
jgi:hypothetical protein